MDVRALLVRAAALRHERRATARDLCLARRRARAHASRAAQRGFSPRVRAVALHVYVEAGFSAEAAAVFLRKNIRAAAGEPSACGPDVAALKRVVEDWFLALADEQMAAMDPLCAASQRRAKDSAHAFLAERQLAGWVVSMNRAKSLAPSQQDAAERYEHIMAARGAAGDAWQPRRGRTLRKWAAAFRRRWQMRFRKLNKEPALSTQELVAKAGAPTRLQAGSALLAAFAWCGAWALSVGGQKPSKCVPILGPFFRSRNGRAPIEIDKARSSFGRAKRGPNRERKI